MNAFIALGYKSRKRQPIGIDEYARHSMSIPFADAVETRSRNDIFNKYHVCAVVWGRYRKAWNHIILRYIHTLQNLTNFDSVFENKDDIPAVLQLVRTKLESEVTFTPESVRRTFDIIREFGRSGALEKMVDLDSAQRVLEGILEQCPDWLEVETNYQYGG
ncbi:hypothetical protein VNI00_014752 [Paramarasmius palmivorus]|uniref:Uncharacterized protein n=1 Tax=Paramarasmius palmivorus TaxID=297713 RepID=A0AAW0BS11_9AGAR